MTSMAARFVVVAAVAVLVAGCLLGAPSGRGRRRTRPTWRCMRFAGTPRSSPEATAGRMRATFAIRVVNAGTTVSDGPVASTVKQPGRQKGDMPIVTPGPLQPGEKARFKLEGRGIFMDREITFIASFDLNTNSAEVWTNNLTFANPNSVPSC